MAESEGQKIYSNLWRGIEKIRLNRYQDIRLNVTNELQQRQKCGMEYRGQDIGTIDKIQVSQTI